MINSNNDDHLFTVSSSEMDFLTLIEHEYRPPIAFKNKQALVSWTNENCLNIEPLGKRDIDNVALVHGDICLWGGDIRLSYRQIWANINYDYYRSAMKFNILRTEGSLKTVHLYDGNHAVSKKRLGDCWPDAWVNMILVESSLNQSIGAMMEKDPLELTPHQEQIGLHAECTLKTFLRREGSLTKSEIREYLAQARNRFISIQKPPAEILTGQEALDAIELRTMAENANGFFDQLTRELKIDLLDFDSTPLLIR